ncbi:hypothetical protein ACHAWF_008478 [Thalassiosira exigua]
MAMAIAMASTSLPHCLPSTPDYDTNKHRRPFHLNCLWLKSSMSDTRSSPGASGRHRTAMASVALLVASASFPAATSAFSSCHRRKMIPRTPATDCSQQWTGRPSAAGRSMLQKADDEINTDNGNMMLRPVLSTATAASLALALAAAPLSPHQQAFAFEESDYASETVTNVVSRLKSSAGDVEGTFNSFEEVAKIITEGKGVGGTLTYDGVRLNEGFVADEDTTIYNPGLTLLTSSEKERLVSAVVENRKVGLSTQKWSENNEYAFDFLKQKLDPLHMYELEGYLGILPFWGAALYLVALFVQKNARGIFPLVYGLCALGVFGPAFLLVANGP